MSGLRQTLQNKIGNIFLIYGTARELYYYTEYCYNPTTQEEVDFMSSPTIPSQDFRFICKIMFRTLILEVAKLYGNDRLGIKKLVTSLYASEYYGQIGIPEDFINRWIQELDNNKDVIERVLLLRDKLIAHTDNPHKDYTADISFLEIKKLIDFVFIIINDVSDVALDCRYGDEPIFKSEEFSIIKLLAKAEKQRLEDIKKQFERFAF